MAGGSGSIHGTGGMLTKIRAADIIIKSGEKMIIADGREEGILQRILKGEKLGTVFTGKGNGMAARKRWIAFNMPSGGLLTLDDGAVRALRDKKKSLLATGIIRVEGDFEHGEAVELLDPSGVKIGKGIVNYNSEELILIMGKKTEEIKNLLDGTYYDEVINRDHLIVF